MVLSMDGEDTLCVLRESLSWQWYYEPSCNVLRKVLREFHHWCCGWNLEALKGQLTWGWPSHFAHQWQKWHWPNDQWCVPLFHEPQNLEEMLVTSPMMRSLGGVETCKLENCKDTDSWGTNLLNVLLLLHRCERCWLKCSQAFPRNWWEVFRRRSLHCVSSCQLERWCQEKSRSKQWMPQHKLWCLWSPESFPRRNKHGVCHQGISETLEFVLTSRLDYQTG